MDDTPKAPSDWLSDVRAEFMRSGSVQAAFRAELDRGTYLPVSHESAWPYPLAPRALPKRIWMYWSQGWANAAAIVTKCRESWIKKNPCWDVAALDDRSTSEHVADSGLMPPPIPE